MVNNGKVAYTVKELAVVLNIGKNSAYNLVNSNGFPRLKIGKKLLIPVKALDQWLEKKSLPTS